MHTSPAAGGAPPQGACNGTGIVAQVPYKANITLWACNATTTTTTGSGY